jgi:hypothetical protein
VMTLQVTTVHSDANKAFPQQVSRLPVSTAFVQSRSLVSSRIIHRSTGSCSRELRTLPQWFKRKDRGVVRQMGQKMWPKPVA